MQKTTIYAVILALVACVFFSGCSSAGPAPSSTGAAPAPGSGAAPASQNEPAHAAGLSLTIDGVLHGGTLPDRFTCKGASESPGLSWQGAPEGTKSLVLIFDDPDAPGGTFTHWILYNIPPAAGSIAPAQSFAKVLANGAWQGDSSAGQRGYYPVCPPIGTTHRYIFRLYAVDQEIALPTATRDSIDQALDGHTLATTEISTTFSR